jgi:tetratricopeptide (TPR) repeat protein
MHDLALKSLTGHDLGAALEKASVYRALNQPDEAESICHDVLAVEPKNQLALRTLGLALTDRLPDGVLIFDDAMKVFAKLEDEYERTYHQGIAWERLGKAHLARGEGHGALTSLEHALEHYEKAEEIGPKNAADPVLRWNRCVRLITEHRLLRDAVAAPHSREPGLGD